MKELTMAERNDHHKLGTIHTTLHLAHTMLHESCGVSNKSYEEVLPLLEKVLSKVSALMDAVDDDEEKQEVMESEVNIDNPLTYEESQRVVKDVEHLEREWKV